MNVEMLAINNRILKKIRFGDAVNPYNPTPKKEKVGVRSVCFPSEIRDLLSGDVYRIKYAFFSAIERYSRRFHGQRPHPWKEEILYHTFLESQKGLIRMDNEELVEGFFQVISHDPSNMLMGREIHMDDLDSMPPLLIKDWKKKIDLVSNNMCVEKLTQICDEYRHILRRRPISKEEVCVMMEYIGREKNDLRDVEYEKWIHRSSLTHDIFSK